MEAYNREHVEHVNYIMAEVHDDVNNLYEGFIDRDYSQMSIDCDLLIDKITNLKKSITDE